MHLAFTENCCLMVCTLHLKKKKSLAYVIQNVQSYRTTREHSHVNIQEPCSYCVYVASALNFFKGKQSNQQITHYSLE